VPYDGVEDVTRACHLDLSVEPDFGLLDHLLSLHVLTPRQSADVRSERTVYRRNVSCWISDIGRPARQVSESFTANWSTAYREFHYTERRSQKQCCKLVNQSHVACVDEQMICFTAIYLKG